MKGETGFDDQLRDITPPREDRGVTAAEQQAIEELIQIIEEYEASLSSPSVPSATVEGRITDLERSIESRPNRAESYLKLERAYQEAGEDKKAAEVYRRARERFPESERVRRKLEAFRNERERPRERNDEDDSYSDEAEEAEQ